MATGGWILFGITLLFAGPAMVSMTGRSLRALAVNCPEPESWPKVSVVIAARDEEQRIGPTLSGLLASDYPALQVVLANDRSADRTLSIATEIATRDPRLEIVSINTVPDGWLGKCNAMARAVEHADGEYLLFTDGDIQFEPDTIRLSMRYVLSRELQHFCLFPTMETHSWMESALVAFFAMLFSFGTLPWLRATRFSRAYYGIGAFNLVERRIYESAGGHGPIALDVLDDVKLGKLLLHHRAQADFLVAGSAVRVRWQDSAWGVIRGLEKNAFASMHYSWCQMVLFTTFYSAVFFLPWCMLLLETASVGYGYVSTLALLHVAFGWLSTRFGAGWLVIPGLLPASVGVLFAFWRSAWKTWRRGGVLWRDTFYSLDALRRGLYR